MTVFHTKAAAITNLDATPPLRATVGAGAVGVVKTVEAFATPTASAAIDTTIQLVRLPWSSIVKEIVFDSKAQDTTGMFDIGVYHATDMSNAASKSALLAADAVDQDLFTITALDAGGNAVHARLVPGGGFRITIATPAIDENTVWTRAFANTPLWLAAGLTADPGGNADIVATITEAPGAATTPIFIAVKYIDIGS